MDAAVGSLAKVSSPGRPPLWLASAATAAAWGALYSVGRWVFGFVTFPIHEDARINYVAAQAGLRFGWSRIYDFTTLRQLSQVFPAAERSIDATATYISPPLLAWLFVPLTLVPEPVAYLIWTLGALAALVWTWHVSAPYDGLAKLTLLLAALALWPVMQVFYYGQPGVVVVALVALAWWLIRAERPISGGVALAFATALKPQVVILVPLALLAAGRIKPVVGWVAAGLLLAVLSAANIGIDGISSYWQALKLVQDDTGHAYFTIAQVFGLGPLTYVLLAIQGIACLAVARIRRHDLETVFAVGLLGSLMVAFHLHQWDYTNLVLGAWLVLRNSPPLWHRVFLAAGVLTMQLLSIGVAIPQLAWDVVWLGILAAGATARSKVATAASEPRTSPLRTPQGRASG